MGDLTLFEALTGGAFDYLNWQHSGEFDQNFSKKSNVLEFAQGGGGGRGGVVLELTGTLFPIKLQSVFYVLVTTYMLVTKTQPDANSVSECIPANFF